MSPGLLAVLEAAVRDDLRREAVRLSWLSRLAAGWAGLVTWALVIRGVPGLEAPVPLIAWLTVAAAWAVALAYFWSAALARHAQRQFDLGVRTQRPKKPCRPTPLWP